MNAPAQNPTRPVLRWHGGKWKLAPRIMEFFPPHRVYVEPFGGAFSICLRKARAYAEVYNDLDDHVVTLFRVLQNPAQAARLDELLRLTPFARREFEIAWDASDCPIEQSRRLVIRAFMGFGSNAHNSTGRGHRSTGFRANSSRSGTTPAQDWANYLDCLRAIIARLSGVVIESRDAVEVMAAHDGAETLFYVDPPYLPETRSPANKYDGKYRMYRHELDRGGHARLLDAMKTLEGMIVLSGYPDALYDEMLAGWRRFEIDALADGARPRTEVLWINPACWQRLEAERSQRSLFEVSA